MMRLRVGGPAVLLASCVTFALAGCDLKEFTVSTTAPVLRAAADSLPEESDVQLALASAINLNRNDLARVVELPKAIALIKRSHELDPKFYNGGAAMTLGIIYCSQGKAIGGDPDLGKKFFEEAINLTGGKYLMARVMFARFYGVITQDRPLFEKTLKEVIATPCARCVSASSTARPSRPSASASLIAKCACSSCRC